ncbi:hypothetical protein PHYBLDRAFT_71165 [Phycomyces blakesleeanus NRRL 1555(-)]|uniref:Uncharacterized protein n=1 Tax=Phycomyces blakesleeanus (strain ATCC 8743b / DSM 1359 / FGSC 10004 / NBRC 33097 / NRRL 1555) TaxID=763407 RepID=A0A162T4P6_PHYB8|nr:hypothetical protein PHYBLDRAFT_71165 [Phycomyces blakesleeanus NRRL 1555(-)]OAD66252.1 hypothetical protein PHYBLDRAFT_71165 [Phycomyces blakesleeanus NRRL 1555(-)]|eukprot:XP_018284292.1 hypothetical protein PHYBLDRAFT_71165 [Phycomyces blakesleeanus NRRL 1555(-)]
MNRTRIHCPFSAEETPPENMRKIYKQESTRIKTYLEENYEEIGSSTMRFTDFLTAINIVSVDEYILAILPTFERLTSQRTDGSIQLISSDQVGIQLMLEFQVSPSMYDTLFFCHSTVSLNDAVASYTADSKLFLDGEGGSASAALIDNIFPTMSVTSSGRCILLTSFSIYIKINGHSRKYTLEYMSHNAHVYYKDY